MKNRYVDLQPIDPALVPAPKTGATLFVDSTNSNKLSQKTSENVVSEVGGGGGLSDAASDGSTYGRKDGAWVAITTGGAGAYDPNEAIFLR